MITRNELAQEIDARVNNRSVTAMIYMVAPREKDSALVHDSMIVSGGRPVLPLESDPAFVQCVHFWQQDDRVKGAKIETSPALLGETIKKLHDRRALVNNGGVPDAADQRTVFDSEDAIEKAIGISGRLSLQFSDKANPRQAIEQVPFVKLQRLMGELQDRLEDLGGTICGADIEHGPLMSCFDYYAQQTAKFHPGHRFSYGEIMLNRGHNTLLRAGVPMVFAPKKGLH